MINLKQLLSKIFIIIGTAFIGVSIVLFVDAYKTEKNATETSQLARNIILTQIEQNINQDKEPISPTIFPQIENEINEVVTIDDSLYVGLLAIPKLGLELPIQTSWSYPKLKNSPCIYQESPFSIAGHNYQAHFANIGNLQIGDEIFYTTINGNTYAYEVILIETIHGSETEKLDDFSYDLSLFTCNYNNNSERVLVRLGKI